MSQSKPTEIVAIRLYYDFASTLCYVAHRVLSEVESRIDDLAVELEWQPIDLTMMVPWNRGDSFTDEVRTSIRSTAQTLGVDVEMPDPWLDSRPASNIALAMPSRKSEARWRSRVFDSIFEQGQVELTGELHDLANELIGKPQGVDDAEERNAVEQSTQDATALGVNGVPTFLLDNLLLGGIYDGDSMVSVLRQLSEHHRQSDGSAVN